jgi:hypothetical protein
VTRCGSDLVRELYAQASCVNAVLRSGFGRSKNLPGRSHRCDRMIFLVASRRGVAGYQVEVKYEERSKAGSPNAPEPYNGLLISKSRIDYERRVADQ